MTGVDGSRAAAEPAQARVHLPGLDGLRGLAVVAVVVFHFWPEVLPGGFLGVSLFFTLSGYLITGLLLAEHERHGRVDLRAFWSRRFRRLLPAALVTLAAVAVLRAWLTSPADLGDEIVAALAYVYNWYLIATGGDYGALFSQPSPIEHFWSLAIEEQFYVVFPVVAVLALRAGRRGLGAVVAVLLAGSVLLNLSGALAPAEAYLSPLPRAAEILVGALLAVVVPIDRLRTVVDGRVARWVAATFRALAVVAVVVASRGFDYDDVVARRGFLVGFACVSAVAIVGAASAPVARVLGTAVPRWLGQRSYGIYLVHWPVEVWMPVPGAVKVLVTLALAELSYRLVETPIRSRRALVARPRALVAGSAAVAVVAVLAVVPASITSELAAGAGTAVTVPPRPAGAGGPGGDVGTPPAATDAGPATSDAGQTPVPAPPSTAVEAAVLAERAQRVLPEPPGTIWLVGDSQLHGLVDWVTQRRDPTVEVLWGREASTEAYPVTALGRDVTIVDLARPGCDGGEGVAMLELRGRSSEESAECMAWQDRWARALADYGPPDVVVWMVGGSTVWIPRSFEPESSAFKAPTDPEWQRWWARTAGERLDWIGQQVPAARVLWTTPVTPLEHDYSTRAQPSSMAYDDVVASVDEVVEIQRRLSRERPQVVLADLGRWAERAGPGGGVLGGTFDGVHWDRDTALGRVWPWLLDRMMAPPGG